ncbi:MULTISPECIES: zinc metalloprotease HtpX [Aminobacter]|jgi:heat shock protein HtpX|uniref:Heat shock protein HtpX n=2 Tax=Aminobacter TaxID=31988 RepID=A0AAC8YJT4_AMIAI|nr:MULTISPECIES: zinc metalloprotease HtpX [Aminobacter]AMS39672.1 Peptidase M48 Ste24p [Aminobacter aminovorans]MBA8907346.1 heat shock protein HtpX [Aminobacter ciceronei]MBA9021118.1 heat shock protein HtpX [Aminobacter ciceronei]MBB3708213.1 heat shock protein HtpX [Aminobacter aminovorans]MRX33769.1 M48 family metalloprotease [Aminobacter sp. MDW-2]
MSELQSINLFERRRNRALNTAQTWLLGAGSLLLLGVTAWAFAGSTGILYALVFGALSMWAVRRISPQMVLSMYKARQVTPADFPAGFRIVEELARRAELPAVPKLYVIPSKMMNAFAVGRRNDAAIAVTDALARNLTPREFAGVLAHEISHIAHEDVKVMAFADMVSRFTSFMSTVGLVSLFLNLFGFAGGFGTQVPWLAVLVLLAAPTVGGLLQMALSRTREFDADLGAAILTGDPDGLASALTKLERAQGRVWENILLPSGRIPDPSVLRTHPLTADRVARLRALKTTGAPEPIVTADSAAVPHGARPSMIPKIRARPGTYLPQGARGFINAANTDFADDSRPACDASLNPPDKGRPRIRVTRGGVWW